MVRTVETSVLNTSLRDDPAADALMLSVRIGTGSAAQADGRTEIDRAAKMRRPMELS